jgi:pyruvate dehydrogenase E1 component alpha subunit
MLLMRRVETMIDAVGPTSPTKHYHLYIGQEAAGAGMIEALRPDDLMATTHRNHGHIVGRGAEPKRAIAEFLGKSGGLNGGLGGTFHFVDRKAGFLSTSAIVGGSFGIATGGGHAAKRAGKGAISVACFGDAAMQEGVAFECLNIAALWSLPVLYFCENNDGGARSEQMAAKRLIDIAAALGVDAETVDGNDPEAVFAAVSAAAEKLRAGHGPHFIEAHIAPWKGAFPKWPELAPDVADIEAALAADAKTDPVLRYAQRLARDGVQADDMIALDRSVIDLVTEGCRFAEASPLPAIERAFGGAFA